MAHAHKATTRGVRTPSAGDEIRSTAVGPAGVDMTDARPHDDDAASRKVARREAPEALPEPATRRHWVLVADEAFARILEWPGPGQRLETVATLSDPAAHAKDGDLRRDAQGRRAGTAPTGSRQGSPEHRLRGVSSVTSSAGEDPQHLEAERFARQVNKHLAEALQRQGYDELRIVAAPRFLGRLRQVLDAHVKATVVEELDKDLVHMNEHELTKRLFGEAAADGLRAEHSPR